MELSAISSTAAIKDTKKVDDAHEGPKTAFINSAFGFGFNNNNSGDAAAFQA